MGNIGDYCDRPIVVYVLQLGCFNLTATSIDD